LVGCKFVTSAFGQHEEHHQDQAVPAADRTDANKAGGMMSGGMMMGQNETGKLIEQLMKSFAAIEAEKDSTALKAKLAEHGSLLKELRTKTQAQSHMMDVMQHMMGGPAKGESKAGDEHKH
jgi:hypothetical protein